MAGRSSVIGKALKASKEKGDASGALRRMLRDEHLNCLNGML
jgi:hypothetical protein